jgi:hypothetical protein
MSISQLQEIAAATTYGTINQSIRTLDFAELEHCNAIGDTFAGHVKRLVTLYAAVKPLLAVIATLPLVPQSWRAAVALFIATLDAVTSPPQINPDFKAGKDL